jgi:hypothetical protein
VHRAARRRIRRRRGDDRGRGGGVPRSADRVVRRNAGRPRHRAHDDLRRRGGRSRPRSACGRSSGRRLVHGGDGRAAPERPVAPRGDRGGRRANRRYGCVLHGQLRAPLALRERPRARLGVGTANPRASRERLAAEPRRARRGRGARSRRPGRARRRLPRAAREAAAAAPARRLLRHRPPPRRCVELGVYRGCGGVGLKSDTWWRGCLDSARHLSPPLRFPPWRSATPSRPTTGA